MRILYIMLSLAHTVGWLATNTIVTLVYTITHRRLYDPTANRLENFWWHVWGSKRRDLSGATVARLYKNISLGPTFVPLRTPTSRYEGPSVWFTSSPYPLSLQAFH